MYNLTWCNEKECNIDSVILLSKCVTWIESRGNIRNINWSIPKEKKKRIRKGWKLKLKARKEKNETRKEMKIKKKRKGNKLGGREGDKKKKKTLASNP